MGLHFICRSKYSKTCWEVNVNCRGTRISSSSPSPTARGPQVRNHWLKGIRGFAELPPVRSAGCQAKFRSSDPLITNMCELLGLNVRYEGWPPVKHAVVASFLFSSMYVNVSFHQVCRYRNAVQCQWKWYVDLAVRKAE